MVVQVMDQDLWSSLLIENERTAGFERGDPLSWLGRWVALYRL
jgi:hypothetical protein